MKRRKRSRRLKPPVADDGSVNPTAILLLVEQQQIPLRSDRSATHAGDGVAGPHHPVCRGGEHRIENTQMLNRTVKPGQRHANE